MLLGPPNPSRLTGSGIASSGTGSVSYTAGSCGPFKSYNSSLIRAFGWMSIGRMSWMQYLDMNNLMHSACLGGFREVCG